ncbi:MAG: hypothetical protein K2G55_14425, partial [Lachnospiraceae bacterium]|nr:hypothetical protein [Lachnospiraceae bacterium]
KTAYDMPLRLGGSDMCIRDIYMGSLIAPFDDKGVLQTHTTSGDSLTSKSGKNKNTVDSDMFLTLLVAEMQNQDPLEPTSNTEWVSQYATFTQVQKMSEMAESIDVLRANELIGKEVIMKTTSTSTGEVNYTQGIVDFVEMENGKPLLVIDDAKYSISDLDTIVSSQYSAAYEKYSTFKEMIDALPDVAFANRTYENVIQGAFDYYNTMDEYQKNYMKIYGSAQMEKFTEWKLELENMGIEFKDSSVEEDEKKTSLDDILESFNTKMNAILDKLNLLAENKETVDKNTDQSNTDTAGKTDEITNDKNNESNTGKTDEVTGGQTDGDNTGKTDETTGNKTEENNTDKTDETTGGQTTEDTTDKTEENTGDQSGESGTE